jgi:hypothetical protein
MFLLSVLQVWWTYEPGVPRPMAKMYERLRAKTTDPSTGLGSSRQTRSECYQLRMK